MRRHDATWSALSTTLPKRFSNFSSSQSNTVYTYAALYLASRLLLDMTRHKDRLLNDASQ